MFDVKSEAHEFVAESRAAAVSQAVEFFGLEESELEICEPTAGSVAGLGGRVVIVAVPPRRREEGRRGGREEPREERGRERGEGREGRERGGRGGRGRERSRDRGRDRDRDRGREEARGAEEKGSEPLPSKGTPRGELGDVGSYVLGAIERMGLGNFEIAESREDDFLVIEVHGDAAPRLHGGDGRAVDALQLLANQFAMRQDDSAPRVVVDAEGDREDREEALERLAQRAARRAQESKRSIALDPMSGRDRRIVHMALREEDGIATMSVGEGRYRQVVVVPEGSPDYDQALRNAEEATRRDR